MQRNINPSVAHRPRRLGFLVRHGGNIRESEQLPAGASSHTCRCVEPHVLSRAVRWHAQSRVLLHGSRNVVLR